MKKSKIAEHLQTISDAIDLICIGGDSDDVQQFDVVKRLCLLKLDLQIINKEA